jgi:hypothetical protein
VRLRVGVGQTPAPALIVDRDNRDPATCAMSIAPPVVMTCETYHEAQPEPRGLSRWANRCKKDESLFRRADDVHVGRSRYRRRRARRVSHRQPIHGRSWIARKRRGYLRVPDSRDHPAGECGPLTTLDLPVHPQSLWACEYCSGGPCSDSTNTALIAIVRLGWINGVYGIPWVYAWPRPLDRELHPRPVLHVVHTHTVLLP